MIIRVLFLLLVTASMLLADDESTAVGDFDLDHAAQKNSLSMVGETAFLHEQPFTGTAISEYPDGKTASICQYHNGLKNGTMIAFFPDGAKELEASYLDGMLNGRFRGWDDSGELLYDLWFDRGMMKQDLMIGNRMEEVTEYEEDMIDADGKDMKED